jgi:hypothetical protein
MRQVGPHAKGVGRMCGLLLQSSGMRKRGMDEGIGGRQFEHNEVRLKTPAFDARA